jgi:hypothetical protein
MAGQGPACADKAPIDAMASLLFHENNVLKWDIYAPFIKFSIKRHTAFIGFQTIYKELNKAMNYVFYPFPIYQSSFPNISSKERM